VGILDDIAGFFGLGGGGGSSSTSYAVTSTVQGGSKPVAVTSTIQGGSKAVGFDLGLEDIDVTVGGGDQPVHTRTELLVPETIKTASEVRSELAVTEPIVSEVSSSLDVEPLQVDLCLDVGLTKLPRAAIRQPYRSHFAVTVLGTELFGFDFSGQSNTLIDELPKSPHVELGGEHDVAHGRHRPGPGTRGASFGKSQGGELLIRLD
jgi:hypothetical protein